jgi:hypothetical protein
MSNTGILPGGQHDDRGRAGSGGGFAKSVAGSAARGAALIALAVIIGIVLLQVIDDGTSGPIGDGGNVSAGGTTPTTAPTTDNGGDGSSSTSSTTAATPAKQPAEVAVLVLNGSGRPGAATSRSNSLKAEGYQTKTPADAPQRQGTVVYYKPGYDRECTTVASIVGGAPQVQPIPNPPPTGSETANCVVILGT